MRSHAPEDVCRSVAVFRKEFSRAVITGATRLHFTRELARGRAHTSTKSDFKSRPNSIFGDFFFQVTTQEVTGCTSPTTVATQSGWRSSLPRLWAREHPSRGGGPPPPRPTREQWQAPAAFCAGAALHKAVGRGRGPCGDPLFVLGTSPQANRRWTRLNST